MKLLIALFSVLIVLLLVSSVTHACGLYLAHKAETGEIFNIKAFDTAKECEADKDNRIKTARQAFTNIRQTDKSNISDAEKRVREKFGLQQVTPKLPPGFRLPTSQEQAEIELKIALSSFCSFHK